MGYWLRGHEGKSCFSIEEKMKHDFWWNNFFETTGHAYFLDITYATSCSNKSWRQITLCVQVGWLNAATHHSDKSLTREFLWKSLSPQQNFIAITSCTNSVWFDFLQHVAATKVCCRDKDFQKNSPVYPKQPVTTCVPTFMLCSTPMTTNTSFLKNFLWLKK